MSYYTDMMNLVDNMIERERNSLLAQGIDENGASRIAYSRVIGILQVEVASLLYCHRDQEEAKKELDRMKKL